MDTKVLFGLICVWMTACQETENVGTQPRKLFISPDVFPRKAQYEKGGL